MEAPLIATQCEQCTGDKGEIEFFCRTCQTPICRNCLLTRHLNLGSNDTKEEKERLLDIYERKTIAERTTVNIKEELKLEQEPTPEKPQQVMHEIMDIKAEFVELRAAIQEHQHAVK